MFHNSAFLILLVRIESRGSLLLSLPAMHKRISSTLVIRSNYYVTEPLECCEFDVALQKLIIPASLRPAWWARNALQQTLAKHSPDFRRYDWLAWSAPPDWTPCLGCFDFGFILASTLHPLWEHL